MNITKVVHLVNRTLSIVLMVFFAAAFCWFCIFLFIIITIPGEVWKKYAMVIIGKFLLNIYMDLMMFLVIVTSSLSTREGRTTMTLLFEIINSSKSNMLNDKLILFINQIKYMPMKFTCGLFDYDWKLCFKFISASLMYFIIMIQFEKTKPSFSSANNNCTEFQQE